VKSGFRALEEALVAVLCKLHHALYGRFKSRQPFGGSKLYRLPEEPRSRSRLFPQRRPHETSKEKRFLHLQKRNLS
jgi:hypothetical protein